MPYDENENYILPDGCAASQEPIEAQREPDVPLGVQLAALEPHLGYSGLVGLIEFMIEHWSEISRLAVTRLTEGYPKYRSAMYGWDKETRDRAICEEMADSLNYYSSGEV